jgi:CheY-like chemotaxis protein
MSQSPSVLIVEPSADDREVLRTVLERRGLRIWEAAAVEQGLELAREHHPDVIVLDAEANHAGDESIQAEFDAISSEQTSSLIVLGRISRDRSLPASQVIAKPYHFGPLIHKIELLAARAA